MMLPMFCNDAEFSPVGVTFQYALWASSLLPRTHPRAPGSDVKVRPPNSGSVGSGPRGSRGLPCPSMRGKLVMLIASFAAVVEYT